MDVPLHDSLDGQVALVTGANRGIGAAIAAGLVELGATVYGGVRDPSSIEAPDVEPVALDLTDGDRINAAVETLTEQAGRLDILVNNAGVIGPEGPLDEIAPADWDRVIQTNVRGSMLVTRAALPLLFETEGPRVVTVSSGAGSFAEGMMPSHIPYCVSKAALNALTFLLDDHYAARGLLVNAVCPGWVRTDMGGRGASRSPQKGAETPVWLARFEPGAPSGRFWRDREPIEW